MKTRAAAAKIIGQLIRQQGSLASLLPEYFEKIPDNEQSLLQELCYGSARWFPKLDLILNSCIEKPFRAKDADVFGLLIVGLYQLIYMRVPDHAALHASVEATKDLKKPWAKGVVNGVLRHFLRDRDTIEQTLQKNAVFCTAHPPWLIGKINKAWPDDADDILKQNNAHPPFTLRVNNQKISRDDVVEKLKQAHFDGSLTPVSRDGITLSQATNVLHLPGFTSGEISVQDEAPQLAATLLDLQPNQRVLDACSAPGGKTAHILETEPLLNEVVALDISEKRLDRTKAALERLELKGTLVAGDAAQPDDWWDGNGFDRILIDAPCSATGIIRRQPDVKMLRTPEQVTVLVATQRAILSALWPLLNPGGKLLYATCSILPEENHKQISHFLSDTSDAKELVIDVEWGLACPAGRQLFPQSQGHDGFYYALLQKNAD